MPDKRKVKVIENLKETPSVNILGFSIGEDFAFKAGQFFNVHLQNNGKIFSKSYSISSIPSHKGFIETIIKRVPNGFASNYLCDLKEGDEVEISGPYGTFVLKEPLINDIVFVATGTGLAPFMSMLYDLFERKFDKNITLIFGVRTVDDIILRDELQQLSRWYPKFTPVFVLSRDPEWTGEKGHVQDIFKKLIDNPFGKDIYICGLSPMISDMKKLCAEMEIPKENIHTELYV
jgi:ferredoxin-NADP reductase